MISPFHHQPFTSTLHKDVHKIPINLWLIMITAMFFFLILSWYNVVLSLYTYFFNLEFYTSDNHNNERDNWKSFLSSFGFSLLWTVLAILIYLFLDSYGYLSSDEESNYGHPLLRDEIRDFKGI